MPRQRKITRPGLSDQPFLLVIEFPSYADADCARELLEPMALGTMLLRAKNDYSRPTASTAPRMIAMRKALASRRSFDREMIAEALDECGYASNLMAIGGWCELAIKYGVIRRIERGLFEFIPAQTLGAVAVDIDALRCKFCQPELLQCPAC